MKTSPKPRTRKQNDLFRGGPRIQLNACVGTNGGPYDLFAYSRGYFHAGERLVRSLIASSRLIDLAIYPLVFTYRHAVELGLKDLAGLLPRVWRESHGIHLTHKLMDNWQSVLPYLTRAPVFDPNDPVVAAVQKTLANLVEMDPTGEAFRFPTARDGSPFLQDTALINVPVFAKQLIVVDKAFDYWHYTAYDAWQAQFECREP